MLDDSHAQSQLPPIRRIAAGAIEFSAESGIAGVVSGAKKAIHQHADWYLEAGLRTSQAMSFETGRFWQEELHLTKSPERHQEDGLS